VRRRVVITGMGAITALGAGVDVLHERAVDGVSGIVDGTARCDGFDAGAALGRREARRTDRFTQLALVAADEAVRMAGWDRALPAEPERIGCAVSSAIGGLSTIETQLDLLRAHGADAVSPLAVPMLMANAAAARVAAHYGLRGEALSIATACASGAQAIVAGARAIRAGDADAFVVGGAEAVVSPFTASIFLAAGALSPTGRSVPFDRERDGFILGEGAGVLILEAAEVAEARGATVLGDVLGYGLTCDAHHLTAPEPSGATAARAVSLALADAGSAPADVDYVNAHGTGTPLNDPTEVSALRQALGDRLATIPISSSKSYLGHLIGAAGAVEAIATVQALRYGTAPPTVGLDRPDETLGPLTHVFKAAPLEERAGGRIGISNSFAFGGHNVTLVLRGRAA
jgi:3-oxoacyl-[acyl-carrier-protein] synthase II